MWSFLYNIFVGPIQFLLEVFFSIIYRFTDSKILSILGISLIVNFCVLPLYNKSDAIQDAEREKQKQMSKWVNHIKKNFTGDKKYMMLLTYYRQQNYKPIYALKGSFSLLLQIPFFIAAYNFLSSNGLLAGESFLFIHDLSQPDHLFQIGSFYVNILPIIMTVINFVAGYIYTKDFELKEQAQLYITALVFLVLLYTSPSGLVIYWILNNLFSLVKNILLPIFKKRKKQAKPVAQKKETKASIFEKLPKSTIFVYKRQKSIFVLIASCLYVSILCGIAIPLDVISASPWDFTYSTHGWMDILLNTFGVYLGFSFWIILVYSMVSDKVKYAISFATFVISQIFVCNYNYFYENYGSISDDLVYNTYPAFFPSRAIINLLVLLVLFLLLYLAYHFKILIAKALVVIGIISAVISLVPNIAKIYKATGSVNVVSATTKIEEPIITLSSEGENVVVIMIDRASGFYLPRMLEEKPELAEIFDGFVYYPNTLSYGPSTNFTTPSLFGGYEYTPVMLNARDTESLSDKQNEALSVLPVLFNNNSYDVTVCDPPYVGDYSLVPDLSIYDEYENINGYITTGNVVNDTYRTYSPAFMAKQYHNFIAYSLFRCAPNVVRPYIYHVGDYRGVWESCVTGAFLDSYVVLEELSNLTTVVDDDSNHFLMFQNGTSHEPVYLAAPDYVPQTISVTTIGDVMSCERGYDSNMAAILQLANWINYLKESGAYDNTRIIITADHGHRYGETEYVYGFFNPLLLVKDFNSTGTLETNDVFMTNADVPTIATSGVIENPINPFTGNPIDSSAKDEDIYVVFSTHYNTLIYNDTTFDTSDGTWYRVHDNVFDPNCWEDVNYMFQAVPVVPEG